MTFLKRNIKSEKELFFTLLRIVEEFPIEDAVDCSIMIFFENGEEIIKRKKQKEAYQEIILFLENNKIMKIYTDEKLSCVEKALILTYIE